MHSSTMFIFDVSLIITLCSDADNIFYLIEKMQKFNQMTE